VLLEVRRGRVWGGERVQLKLDLTIGKADDVCVDNEAIAPSHDYAYDALVCERVGRRRQVDVQRFNEDAEDVVIATQARAKSMSYAGLIAARARREIAVHSCRRRAHSDARVDRDAFGQHAQRERSLRTSERTASGARFPPRNESSVRVQRERSR
jgi:hypothetical protein